MSDPRSGRSRSIARWFVAVLVVCGLILAMQNVMAGRSGMRIDLAPLMVVFFALEFGPVPGILATLSVGYVADVFSGAVRGLETLALLVAFMVVRFTLRRTTSISPAAIVVRGLLATVAATFVVAVLRPGASGAGDATFAPTQWVAGVLFALPVYRLLDEVGRRFAPRDELRFRKSG